jgi:hypothetical protein
VYLLHAFVRGVPVIHSDVRRDRNTVEELLRFALERFVCGDRIRGWRMVSEALSIDPGISHKYSFAGNPIRANLQRILNEALPASTFTGLASICRQLGNEQTSQLLLERYTGPGREAAHKQRRTWFSVALRRFWQRLRRS